LLIKESEIYKEKNTIFKTLSEGGIIIFPTETFYGLGVKPFDKKFVKKIFEVKGRERGKPLPLIASSRYAVEKFAHLSSVERKIARKFWPGPLTLLLRTKYPFPKGLMSRGMVAVRVSSRPSARYLAKLCGGLITATSSNISGQRPSVSIRGIPNKMKQVVDIIVDGGRLEGGLPSTIIHIKKGEVKLVREGKISIKDIEKVLG
jgi:L-threonylcarbamoyladenylate synthase